MTDANRDAVLAMDNPDFDWDAAATPEPSPEPEQTTAEAPEQTAEVATPTPTPAPEAPKPEPVTTTPVDFGHIAKEIREAERIKAEAMAQQAYLQGQQSALQQVQRQQQPPAEPPDMYLDPDGYREWQKAEILREITPLLNEAKQSAASAQHRANLAEAGVTMAEAEQAFAYIQANRPALANAVLTAQNPFKEVMDTAKAFGFQSAAQTQQTTQQAHAVPVITDEIRQQVLTEEAAKRAAAGQVPQLQVPRGVGNTPAGAGHNDVGPPPIAQWSNLAKANPAQWAQTRDTILGDLKGGAF